MRRTLSGAVQLWFGKNAELQMRWTKLSDFMGWAFFRQARKKNPAGPHGGATTPTHRGVTEHDPREFIGIDEVVKAPLELGIVIPTLNAAQTIDETISSIVSQLGSSDVRVHLHIQDGGSTDATLSKVELWILKSREFEIEGIVPRLRITLSSRKDLGMYHAIKLGMEHLRAKWVTWIGADDLFMPWAFKVLRDVQATFPDCRWLIGPTHIATAEGIPVDRPRIGTADICQESIASGFCDHENLPLLQQEGMFWTQSLLAESRGLEGFELFKLAGDFALWTKFASLEEPIVFGHPLAAYRRREGQLSGQFGHYLREVQEIKSRLRPISSAGSHSTLPVLTYNEQGQPILSRHKFQPPSELSTFPVRVITNAGHDWQLLDSTLFEEGPYPLLNIQRSFVWLTGFTQKLRVMSHTRSALIMNLLLGSRYRNQTLRVEQGGRVIFDESLPPGDPGEALVIASIPLLAFEGSAELDLHLSRISSDNQGRLLGVMLFGVKFSLEGKEKPIKVVPIN
jgi:hypothetical protein